jgi:hypothetical protein
MFDEADQPLLADSSEEVLDASTTQLTFRLSIATDRASNVSCGPLPGRNL